MARVRGVAVSASSVVLASESPNRVALVFSVGNSANSASVMLKDQIDATSTDGMPLTFSSGLLRVEGAAAKHRWSAIRLAAVDCVVGVLEEYPEDFAVPDEEDNL